MASKITDNKEIIADINMVPFIDIVLVVLIIFLVTAPAFVKPIVDVQLPKAAAAKQEPPQFIKVSIGITGQIAVNGKLIKETELEATIKQIVDQESEMAVVIAADKDVAHGKVVSVIDKVKRSGVRKFAVSVEPEDG